MSKVEGNESNYACPRTPRPRKRTVRRSGYDSISVHRGQQKKNSRDGVHLYEILVHNDSSQIRSIEKKRFCQREMNQAKKM